MDNWLTHIFEVDFMISIKTYILPLLVSIIVVIPIAVIIIAITDMLYLDLTGRGRRRAKREFPLVATKLGLSKRETGSAKSFGVYGGTFKGHYVSIEPDSGANIDIDMPRILNLKLGTSYNETNFDSRRKGFDAFLTERLAPPQIAHKIRQSRELLDFVDVFRSRWKRKCCFLAVYENYIRCSLKYGNGHYIPGHVLERLLPDMAELVDLLQAAVKSS